MSEGFAYTIPVCNYNMEDTIEESLRSMLDQVTSDFEVLVVDDGSTDASVAIVRELMDEYENLRLVELERDDDRTLGRTRNISIKRASGDYILAQMDADDRYTHGIVDFTKIYHALVDKIGDEFLLRGKDISMGEREFLLDCGPYRNLQWTHDADLWRRLFANDEIVWLDHGWISEEIGYEHRTASIHRKLYEHVCEFQAGISLQSYMRWSLEQWRGGRFSNQRIMFEMLASPLCWAYSRTQRTYTLSPPYDQKGALKATHNRERVTLADLEAEYGIDLDREDLSERGVETFYEAAA